MHVVAPVVAVHNECVGRVRVLFVDDHPVFLDAVTSVLRKKPDIEVVAMATTVEQAYAAVRKFKPDVIVLDVDLGAGDGIRFVDELHDVDPDAKVVMLTCHADGETACAAVRAGAVGFVTKQSAVEDLVQAIRAVTRGESWIPPRILTDVLEGLRARPRAMSAEEEAVARLSEREREVLALLLAGHDRTSIARLLYLSPNTIRTHVHNLLAKLGAHSSVEAVGIAHRAGLRALKGTTEVARRLTSA